jgi:D-aminoacyl-tRNA deacylase
LKPLKIGVIYSVNDIAASGIVNQLLQELVCKEIYSNSGFVKKAFSCKFDFHEVQLLGYDGEVVSLEPSQLEFISNVDFIVIPSRHESSSRIKSFTVHAPGNPWRRSNFGGKPMQLSMSNPVLMWYMLWELNRLRQSYSTLTEFLVSYEVTHHGPTIPTKPVTFIEIGGSEREWSIAEAHKVVAKAIKNAITYLSRVQGSESCTVSVGFGGNHYASLFTKRAFEKNECYGHIVANYIIKELALEDLKIVTEMAIRLTPGVARIVIEKMRSELRNNITLIAKSLELEIVTL